MTPVVKLGESWKKLSRQAKLSEDKNSQITWTPDISQTLNYQAGSLHQLIGGYQHICSRGLTGLDSEIMDLILKRLMALGVGSSGRMGVEVWRHPLG